MLLSFSKNVLTIIFTRYGDPRLVLRRLKQENHRFEASQDHREKDPVLKVKYNRIK